MGVERIINCEKINLGRNVLLKVETSEGKFIIKSYDEFPKQEVELLNFLKIIKVPKLIDWNDNKLIYKYIEGEHKTRITNNELKDIAKEIARLHKQTKNKKLKEYNYLKEAKKIKIKNPIKKEILKRLKKYSFSINLPKGIVHGDIRAQNLLFYKNKFNGIIDFDKIKYTNLIYDLADLVFYWSFFPKQNKENIRLIIDAYESIRELTKNEKKYLFNVMILNALMVSLEDLKELEKIKSEKLPKILKTIERLEFLIK